MQFELLRLSVLPRVQMDSFERRKPDGSQYNREEWLRAVFSESIMFLHRGANFHYVPIIELTDTVLIGGRIGRQVTAVENEPPGDGLAKIRREAWRAASVLIDPTHHLDGQKVAVESLSAVGKPISVFESLALHINGRAEPYLIEANAITPSASFWAFAEENKGEVTLVEFEFVAPNMFGGEEDYDAEMRDMKEKEKAQKARLAIESRDGLDLNTKRIQAAVEYTTRGTGSIKARTKRKRTYNSKAKAQKIAVPDIDANELPQRSVLQRLSSLLFK